VAKPSGTDGGLEAAAIAAAMKNRYEPAYSGSKPVATWVTYSVTFAMP
jgi:hypothetical protein